jgi:hypothetical protein
MTTASVRSRPRMTVAEVRYELVPGLPVRLMACPSP